MGWHQADPVTDPTAGQILDSLAFTHGLHVAVTLALTSPGPWTVILRRLDRQNTITHSVLLASPGGSVVLGPFPDIYMGPGDWLQVVSRDAATGEHQASLFTREGGTR